MTLRIETQINGRNNNNNNHNHNHSYAKNQISQKSIWNVLEKSKR